MSAALSVSVVVPVFNGAETIADMLQAVTTQVGMPSAAEIIIVDNDSTDATRTIVQQFPVTLLEERKRGPSAARNRGLQHARGDLIVHCDADTLPTRRWLAEIVTPFSAPNVHLVSGKTLSFRPETPAQRYFGRAQMHDSETTINRAVLPFVASLNMAVRRSSALAAGGWAEDMMTAEDVEFCQRVLRRFPSSPVYRPQALLFHRNRRTDAQLCRQAWTYGEGAAELYRRYPESLHWGVPQWFGLTRNMVGKFAMRPLTRIGTGLGLCSPDDVEFADYHWRWAWWFWRGFFHHRRHRGYRIDERRGR